MNRRVELLAPAGNPEGFYGAIRAGADAVYLGGDRFNARAYADNFTTDELLACIRYAHILNRRVYLTLNTLVKETEFDSLFPYLRPLYEAGLDGVIVQDLGVFAFVREYFPDMELHASTQMAVTGQYGARLLRQAGAVRVVPARELGLAEIREIKKTTDIQVETFIHGAMCYAYSGQCLFSSILGGRSGNRGRCAGPCRLPYRVDVGKLRTEECHPLSLKDICTIERVPELIDAGIDSFKIEGRMKKPEYAAGVTAIYRKYIDKYYAGEDCTVSREDLETLRNLYIRGESREGYYYRRNGRDMITLQNPSYHSPDEELAGEIRRRYLESRLTVSVKMRADFVIGEPARLMLLREGRRPVQMTVEGGIVQAAQSRPVTVENVRRQLGRLGDTPFCAGGMEIHLEDGAFYPLKSLNELRRRAVDGLEELLILENGFAPRRESIGAPERTSAAGKRGHSANARGNLHVLLRTGEQAGALLETAGRHSRVRRVYLESEFVHDAFLRKDKALSSQLYGLHEAGCELAIALPPVIRSRDEGFLREIWETYERQGEIFCGFLVRSVDGIGFLSRMADERRVAMYGDAGLYVWNRESLRCLRRPETLADPQDPFSVLSGFCLPHELKAADQRRILDAARIHCEKVIYGRIPLMLTANCIFQTVGDCDKGTENVGYLTDRYRKRFPVLRNCGRCMNVIYNSLPLSLHGELSKWRGLADFRLDFTIEDGRETSRVLQYFLSGARGEPPYEEYTTGHEKRGAE